MTYVRRRAPALGSKRQNRRVRRRSGFGLEGCERLEARALLSADLNFALAGPSGGQGLAVATDSSGNVYELGTDAVYKFSASGTKIWSAPYSALSNLNTKEGLAVDASGEVYITGSLIGSGTFGTTKITSAAADDGYLAKLDANGNFLWAESFDGAGGGYGTAVAVDASGNAYLTGQFSGTATIGSGSNTVTLSSPNGTGALVAKFDTNGTLDWAQGITGSSSAAGYGIALDSQADVYVTGQFGGTADFDPAQAGTHQLTTFFGATFFLKLDTDGNYVWAKQLNGETSQGDGSSTGDAVTTDAAGNLFATGTFGGPVNLNPNGGDVVNANFVFPDAYVLKLDAGGNFLWADDLHNVSGSNPFGGFNAQAISVDARGNVYTTGYFSGIANFNPGPGTDNVESAGGNDVYLSVLDGQGNFAWAETVGETGTDLAFGVATSGSNVFVTGSFSNTINFNPGPGVTNVTANGIWDSFLWGLTYPPNEIAGAVWNDQNSDGIRQSAEPGIPGVVVSLYSGTPSSSKLVAMTTSDALGLYSFKGLTAGTNYFVQVAPPAGYTFTTENTGSDLTVDSNVSPTTGDSGEINLSTGQTAIVNAGLLAGSSAPGFGVAFGIPSIGFTSGGSVTTDAAGDFYVAGNFQGSKVSFGSGPGATTLSTTFAPNDFVAKYAPDGSLLWVRQIVSDFGQYAAKVELDSLGNVYLTGWMTGKSTFGSTVLSPTSTSAFLWKLDGQGNSLWADTVAGNASQNIGGLAVDTAGDAYVVGAFSGSTTVGAAPNDTVLSSAGSDDIFAVKVGPDGTPTWAKSYGAADQDGADSVALDPSGNLLITGTFESTVQFGTVSLTGSLLPTDYVAKLNASDGSVAWADALPSTVSSGPSPIGQTLPINRIAVDSAGNVYTTGRFTGTIQLDPTAGKDAIAGTNATFISKLDNNGNFVWGKAIVPGTGGYDVEGMGIAVDAQGDVFTTGEFASTENFNPAGTPAENLTATGSSYDVYVSELDTNGNYVNAMPFGGPGEDSGSAIAVDPLGNVYATGVVSNGPANFSPPPGTFDIGKSGEQDIFVVKLGTAAIGPAVNAAPGFTVAGPPQEVLENAGPQTVPDFLTNFTAGPAGETNEVTSLTVSNNNNALFSAQPSIDPLTGTLTYTPAADESGKATVTVTMSNNGGTANGGSDTVSVTFPITVDFVNQAPSFTEGADQTVDENAGQQTVTAWATNISAGPPSEAGQTLNFTVTTDNNALFSSLPQIDPATGNLTYTPAANVSGVATVTVELHDNGGTANGGHDTSAPQTFTITVNFVNQAPSFTEGADQTVDENAGAQTVTGWATNISAGPPSEAGQTLNFIVTTDNNALFSSLPTIDPATGDLTYTPAANESGVANVTVELHDNGGTANGGHDTSAPQTFTITVNFVNQAPSFTKGADQTVDENAGPQTVVGWATQISAGPPSEAGQTLNFIVTTDNDSLFSTLPAIDASTGTLTYTPAANVSGVATVTVELHDNGGTANGGHDTSAPQTFTITVGFVNQAPSFTAGPNETVNENAGPQSVTGWATNISAGPPSESGQVLNFIVTTDNNALFSAPPAIDPATGDLTYTPATNVSGVADVTVQLHDNGGTANGGHDTSAPQTFTITVNFVNQAPSFTAGADQTVDENAGPQTVTSWATNISAGPPSEAGQTLNFIVTTDNNALFSTLPAIDPATGDLTYAPAANVSGVATVTVELHDNGGTANGGHDTSAPQTFTITVNFVNQAPSFTEGADQTVDENAGPQAVTGWATQISAGPPSEAGQTLNFIVTTDNNALFSSLPQIDPATGDLTYTPAANVSGVATVTVELHDNGGTANGGHDTSAPQTFTITVNFVNQAPSFTEGADQMVDENAGAQTVTGWATNISAGPPNESGQTLNFIVITDNNALFSSLPQIDPATGNLTYTPAANVSGVATVTVELHDNGGTANGGHDTSAPQTFTITVNFVNRAPSFTEGADQTVDENAGQQTVNGWATQISAGPPSEAGQTLNFIVTTDNDALFSGLPAIDPATGDLTYTPAANVSGVAHVSVELHDNGGTANGGHDTSAPQTFTITVNFVNQAPSFTAGASQTLDENAGPQTVTAWATAISAGPPSESGQTLNFIVTTDNNSLFSAQPAIDPATGDLTYTPAANAYGVAHVTVELHDNGGTANGGHDTSAPQIFTITVNFVNQPPSFTAGANQTVDENAGAQTVAAWATQISAGPPNEAGQALNFIVNNDNNALFSVQPTIDPATGNLTYTPAPDVSGVATVSVELHDNGGTANGGHDTSALQTFTITVNFVNQPPSFTAGGDQTVEENAGPQTVAAWATNLSAGPPSEAGQTLNFIVTTDNNALFSAFPTIDPATGTLSYTPAANTTGVAHVSVELHDNGGTANGGEDTSAAQSFTITVNYVNQAPSFNEGHDQTVDENAGPQTVVGWATDISPGPPADAGQVLNFIVTTDNNGLFSAPPTFDPATGNLTYTPAPDVSGTAHVTVELHDNGGTANGGHDTSAPQSFTISVNFVNQAPSFTPGADQTIDENAGPQTVTAWATAISPGPPSEAGQALNFIVTTDNRALFSALPAIDPTTGNLSYTPAANESGVAHVTVLLEDNGGTANGGQDLSTADTFTVTVNFVNQAPSFTAGPNVSVDNDAGPQSIAGWATNINPGAGPAEQREALNFIVSNDDNALFTVQPAIDGLGRLTFTPALGANGQATVRVQLHDNGGTANGGQDTSAAQSFTITVHPRSSDPNAQYVAAVYQSVLHREGDSAGVAFWAQQLDQGTPRATVVNLIDQSTEYYSTIIITPAYANYLGRAPDAAGLAYWVDQMQNHSLTDEELEAGFIGSPEFYQKSGGTDAAWIDALYQTFLGRAADPQGQSYWEAQLAGGETRSQVALGFADSPERQKQRVQDDYFQYLGRETDAQGLDYWVAQLASGLTNEELITGLVASDEYYRDHTG